MFFPSSINVYLLCPRELSSVARFEVRPLPKCIFVITSMMSNGVLPQKIQGGYVGISLDVIWFESATNSKEDIEATQRALDFTLGW